MPHFRVRVAMKKLTIDQSASADASADGEVDQIPEALPSTPAARASGFGPIRPPSD